MPKKPKLAQNRSPRRPTDVASGAPNIPPDIQRRISQLGTAMMLVLVILTYLPAMQAGFIWDDPEHVLNNQTLRSLGGLRDIWTNWNSLPQWYPLTHTTFWIEFQWWGVNPTGYHITNILLHAINALLLWRLLKSLNVRGAWLAAAIFAVHPVMVESVAWITERKNLLSMLFYLLAMRTYLTAAGVTIYPAMRRELDPPPDESELPDAPSRAYFLSLAWFVCALLSKSVAATWPAAILVILWWKRGRLIWRDAIKLIPFFALGLLMAGITSHLERTHVGAQVDRISELNFTALQRLLIAGRAVWFYAGKLIWPANLSFIYPRWSAIDRTELWGLIFPIAAIAVIALLFMLRRRVGRGPLAAVLLFCGTLVPALGFVTVYPMRFSFVADHFQYHAAAALIALFATGVCRLLIVQNRIGHRGTEDTERSRQNAVGSRQYADRFSVVSVSLWPIMFLIVPLAVASFFRATVYYSAEPLWRDTLTKNDSSWMVYTNLAHALLAEDRADAAEPLYLKALELAPDLHETHMNAGNVYGQRGQYADAIREFKRALEINPNFAPAHYGIGQVLLRQNKPDEAMQEFQRALQLDPNDAGSHYRIAKIHQSRGQMVEAVEQYRAALSAAPEFADALFDYGLLLIQLKQFPEASAVFLDLTKLRATEPQVWQNLGTAQLFAGNPDEAIRSFRKALSIDPNFVPAQQALSKLGREQ